jgi:hypothetical protein
MADRPTRKKRGADVGWLVMGIVSTIVGVVFTLHPEVHWTYGLAHTSDSPPAIGVGGLVIGATMIAIALRRIWFAMRLEVEARRHRR